MFEQNWLQTSLALDCSKRERERAMASFYLLALLAIASSCSGKFSARLLSNTGMGAPIGLRGPGSRAASISYISFRWAELLLTSVLPTSPAPQCNSVNIE